MQKNATLAFAMLLLTAIFACQTNSGTPAARVQTLAPIDTLLSQYNEERLPMFPLEATTAGDTRYNDLLPNTISQAYRARLAAFYTKYKTLLQQYDPAKLSSTERMSYHILQWECDINLGDLQFHKELMPLNQFDCLPLQIGQYASGSSAQPFKTVKDYDNWLKRLDAYTVWCDTAIANMRRGMAAGYVIPKVLAEKMVPQMAGFDHGPVEKHLFYTPITTLPATFSPEDRARLTESYKKMIADKIIPTYQKLHAFVKDEYVPRCRTSAGISDIPDGAAYYAHQIKLHTTTTMTADEIFQLGEREVSRIFGEMEAVKKQVGYTGDLKSFFNYVRAKKELMPYTTAEQVVQHFKDIHTRMQAQLARLFNFTPKTPFEVRRT